MQGRADARTFAGNTPPRYAITLPAPPASDGFAPFAACGNVSHLEGHDAPQETNAHERESQPGPAMPGEIAKGWTE